MNLQLPQEGDKIGSGVVVSLVYSGLNAHVYKTWNDTLELHRAVKVVSAPSESNVFERFITEARITSKLIHPNIVQTFNIGTTSGGLPFIEMEYISGSSLEDLVLKGGSLPLLFSLSVCIGILKALSYAHTLKYTLYEHNYLGIVHRDIKPSNIVITTEGVPKLTDFGIARPVDVSIHTRLGTVPGTIAYMSPEACTSSDIDFTSDIYQLGLCLYESLAGKAAFPQSDLTALFDAKIHNDYASLESRVKNLDFHIIHIVRKCMQLKPRDRYVSACDCLSDVSKLYDSLSPSLSPSQTIVSFLSDKDIYIKPVASLRFLKPLSIMSIFVFIVFYLLFVTFKYRKQILDSLVSTLRPSQVSIASPASGDSDSSVLSDTLSASDTLSSFIPGDLSDIETSGKTLKVDKKTDSAYAGRVMKKNPSGVKKSTAKPVSKLPSVLKDDALYWINHGKHLYKSGRLKAAFDNFQKALNMPSEKPSKDIIKLCVYWSAKCNTGLFNQGKCSGSNYAASWRSVKNLFPSGTAEYIEAISMLKVVGE